MQEAIAPCLHTLMFLHLTCPVQVLASTGYKLREAMQPSKQEVGHKVAPRGYHLAPEYLRCVSCGAIHFNAAGSPDPVLRACSKCELKQPDNGTYQRTCTALACAGFYHLTREQMLSYNQLSRQLVPKGEHDAVQ